MKKFKSTIEWSRTILLALIAVILLSTNVCAQKPSGNWKQVYENEVITNSTRIIGQDSVLFYNCTFRNISGEKYALELRNCTNSVIKDCKFYDIATTVSGNVIALRDNQDVVVDNCEIYNHSSEGHSGGITMWGAASENITIQNNNIHDIAGNGIISGGCSSCNSKPNPAPHDVPNLGLKVLNNRIVNVGLSPDLAGNSPKHGMYIKAMDPLIEGNYIEATHDGAGISIRSTGIVRNNFIMNTKISGIICSNMKPAGPSGKIIIENNVVVQKWEGTPTWASPLSAYFTEDPYPVRYHTAIVRFNTVVGYPDINPNLRLMRIDDFGLRTNDQAYGNLIVDLRKTPKFWRNEEEVEYRSNNYTRTNLNDFVDPANLDFRLKESSSLIDVITSEPGKLPSSDRDGDAFVFPLEPGAHQHVAESVNPESTEYWLEAECGTLGALWDSKTDTQASGDGYIGVKPGNNSRNAAPSGSKSYVSYSVNIAKNGQYRLWGRVLSPSSADDSFWLRVDGGEWSLWSVGTNSVWAWRQEGSYALTTGSHTVDLAYREDGTKLDKLYLTTGSSTPAASGPTGSFNCNITSAFPDPAKWYYLENKACSGSGQINRLDTDNCTGVDVDPGSAQDKQWRFELSEDGSSYYVINRACNARLDADNCETVGLNATGSSDDKRWVVSLSEDGVHYLLNNKACGGKNLDTDNCGNVKVAGGNQIDKRWKLVEAGSVNARQGVAVDKEVSEEVIPKEELLVYPNPAQQTLQLRVPNHLPPGQLTLHNLQGRVMLQQNLSGSQTINVAHLPPGLYTIKLQLGQAVGVRKVIIE